MDWESVALWYVALLVSLVVHEAAHALFALLGGDRTAYVGGQVTLNPIPHMQREPFGTIVVPLAILLYSGGTWCAGFAHIPVDPVWAHRYPKRAALMSAAGPLANLLLAAIAFLVLKSLVWSGVADPWPSSPLNTFVTPQENGGPIYALARIATVFLFLNVILLVFNLIPWPPLDGAAVVAGLFPEPMERFYGFVRSQIFLMLIGIIAVWRILPDLFYPVIRTVNGWI